LGSAEVSAKSAASVGGHGNEEHFPQKEGLDVVAEAGIGQKSLERRQIVKSRR
jgi:hypothetical protein